MRKWMSILTLLIASACGDNNGVADIDNTPIDPAEGEVEVWVTIPAVNSRLQSAGKLPIGQAPTHSNVLTIDDEELQPIEGLGAAVTGSSAYVLMTYLSSDDRTTILEELFGEEGLGFSFIRVTIGASDFSLEDFTYSDLPTGNEDLALSGFSIDMEREHLIPVLKEILEINPDIKVMASPWSAPAWMKDSGQLGGGQLLEKYFDVYARYLAKYIKEMEVEGISIKYISVQNEPLHESAYPTMYMSAEDQRRFIGGYLGPELQSEGLDTRILAYDHNWDRPDYPMMILEDDATATYVYGSAFHCYDGQVSAMSTVHDAFPDKALYMTECSGGEWSTDFTQNMIWMTRNLLIGAINNWSRGVLLWNLALDENHGPTNNGCRNCRGVVTVNSQSGAVERNEEYYLLGHLSKFISDGALRIRTSMSEPNTGLEHVAVKNTDGSRVLLVLNPLNQDRDISVSTGSDFFDFKVRAQSLVTFTWN